MAPDNFDPMQTFSFDEVLDRILKSDLRYHREAYHFVREGLDHTQKIVGRSGKDEVRHVSGPELLEGIKEYCIQAALYPVPQHQPYNPQRRPAPPKGSKCQE